MIERIRQIGVLYLTNEAMVAISKIEKTESRATDEIRRRDGTPVCSFNPVTGWQRFPIP